MTRRRIVVESPLAGDVAENLRYLVWCCRALYLAGYEPLASHLGCPWFMDDDVPEERADGIAWSWFWQGDEHVFFGDLGLSRGMGFSMDRCKREGIPASIKLLSEFAPEAWAEFKRGNWPPRTFGEVSFVEKIGGGS